MKTLYKLCLLPIALMLSSCITHEMWEKESTIEHHKEQDTLLGFGIASEDSAPLSKGQIIIIGEKYWYAIDPTSDNELRAILETPFENAYTIEPPTIKITHDTTKNQNAEFSVEPIFLSYKEQTQLSKNEQQQRIDFLKKIGFQFDDRNAERHWNYYLSGIKGTVYRIDLNQRPQLQSFTQTIPLSLHWEITKPSKMIAPIKILLTPFTLAADVASSIIFITYASIVTPHK